MNQVCGSCYWFNQKSRFGRDPRSCQDLGEKPENDSCDRFIRKLRDSETMAEWVEEQVGSLSNVRYRDLFHEILAESFVLEQDAKLSVATIKAQLQAQGAPVILDGKEFDRTMTRLLAIYQTYRLSGVLGLGRFSDEIVSAEIKRRFAPRSDSPQVPGNPILMPAPEAP